MTNVAYAHQFAQEWVDSWNSHNLDQILSHYSDDFTIETPMAIKLYPQSNGLVAGKEEVRKYWTIGLERIPDLKFELLEVLTGVNGISIYYLNTATQKKAVEVMQFNEQQKVYKAIVHYSE
ncbi:nuclear transport factor 2 family protein [Flavobacterium phycosphaerae]|uniref:nuclear transport factor 2 family protein n=1 Tax=Flavobacterium phycosphaerae TaxID=2697515 RepID=UPI00138A14A8|nr:nuclear transport factor 2 family protein [Flavobacterium phycosphaerae]